MSDVSLKLRLLADDASMKKALDRAAKDLDRTGKISKKTSKEIKGLGHSFTEAANNVAIFNGQLDPISGRLSAIGTGIKRFGLVNIAAGVGVAAMVYSIKNLMQASEEYETRQNKFNALLNATGYAARLTRSDLEALAQTTARSTLGDVAGTSEAINALLTFRKVQSEVFKETVKLAVDAKVVFGGNLREGVVAFGKALNDPVANLGALSRKGIQFTVAQKEIIQRMWETGDAAGAQNIILAEMRNQFGGLANQEGTDLMNATDSLSQSWENLMVSMGQGKAVSLASKSWLGLIKILDHASVAVTDIHGAEKNRLEELSGLRETEVQSLNRLKVAEQNLLNVKNSRSGKQALLDAEKGVALQKAAYDRSVLERRQFTLKDDNQGVAKGRGLTSTLGGEVDDLKSKNKQILKLYDQRRIALTSGFENESDKANRVYKQKTKALDESFVEQDTISRNAFDKEIALFDQNAANRKTIADAKIRTIKADTNSEWFIKLESNKILKDLADKNIASDVERAIFIKSHNEKQTALAKAYGDTKVLAAEGLEKKLLAVDALAAARVKAKQLRDERALKVAASIEAKRAKFLRGISGGTGKLAKLDTKYDEQFTKLAKHEADKTFLSDKSAAKRAAIFDAYYLNIAENYTKDVAAFSDAEESKTLRAREAAAKRAGRNFKADSDLALDDQENSVSGLQSFFGVNINEAAEKSAELLAQKQEHLNQLQVLETDSAQVTADKLAQIAEVTREHDLAQAKLKKEGKAKAEADTWDAIGVLGASGSKKAFALAKAMNIAKTIMNTSQAVMNALANIPPPYNIAAAAAIGVSGVVQLSNIKNQKMPQAHDGIDYVPREGTFLLSQGERVLSPSLNADLTADLARRNQNQNGGGETNVNLTLPDTGSYNAIEQWYEDNSDRIAAHVRYAMDRP